MPPFRVLIAAVTLLLWASPAAAALPIPPPPDHRVNDYAGALSQEEFEVAARIRDQIRDME